jgi:hypothetical protein
MGVLVLPKAAPTNIVEQPHAIESHGEDMTITARVTMQNCKDNNGMAEFMSSITGKWMYICFLDTTSKIIMQILSGDIKDVLSREITTFKVSNSENYLLNTVKNGGYILKNTWNINKIPAWFKVLLSVN